jgi:hypothetical protein
MLLPELSR